MKNLLYNRHHLPITDETLEPDIHFFGSSHLGNSVYFPEIRTLIDLGFSYKRYMDYDPNFFYSVDYILLTHEHGDHLNGSTLLKILECYPHVKVIASRALAHAIDDPEFKRIDHKRLNALHSRFIAATRLELTTLKGKTFCYIPHVTSHGDITNVAIELYYDNQHVLYASDLDDFNKRPEQQIDGLPCPAPNNLFTIICLEANYDENILNQFLMLHPNDPHARGNLRHISEQTTWRYVEQYLAPNGVFLPLHASETFGTLRQPAEDMK